MMVILKSPFFWIAGYCLLVAAVVGGLLHAYSETLSWMNSREAQAAWNEWREEAKSKSGQDQKPIEGPVQRRVPKSAEPPALVLLRDHFGICLTGGLLFSSLLYFMLMFAIRGVLLQADEEGETPK